MSERSGNIIPEQGEFDYEPEDREPARAPGRMIPSYTSSQPVRPEPMRTFTAMPPGASVAVHSTRGANTRGIGSLQGPRQNQAPTCS